MSSDQLFANLSPRELEAKLSEDNAALLVDVRTDWEYEGRHIPGARHIPIDQIAERFASELAPSDEIVCICEHGVRSAAAARFLVANGYSNVSHLVGGMAEWNGETEP